MEYETFTHHGVSRNQNRSVSLEVSPPPAKKFPLGLVAHYHDPDGFWNSALPLLEAELPLIGVRVPAHAAPIPSVSSSTTLAAASTLSTSEVVVIPALPLELLPLGSPPRALEPCIHLFLLRCAGPTDYRSRVCALINAWSASRIEHRDEWLVLLFAPRTEPLSEQVDQIGSNDGDRNEKTSSNDDTLAVLTLLREDFYSRIPGDRTAVVGGLEGHASEISLEALSLPRDF